MQSRKNIISLVLCAVLAAGVLAVANEHARSVSPDAALARLQEGNARFTAALVSQGKPTAARRAETAQSQHPFAVIVGCADSRTPPELIFDQNIGDLFVVRVAGNLVGEHALGSIEYAVDHLGVRLVVVLGHERCGAVTAALASPTAHGHVNSLVRDLQPAVAAAKAKKGELLENAVAENAKLVAAKIRREANFGEQAAEVRVVPAVYDLDTGKIEWFKP
jgi:carbonic anhydrase